MSVVALPCTQRVGDRSGDDVCQIQSVKRIRGSGGELLGPPARIAVAAHEAYRGRQPARALGQLRSHDPLDVELLGNHPRILVPREGPADRERRHVEADEVSQPVAHSEWPDLADVGSSYYRFVAPR